MAKFVQKEPAVVDAFQWDGKPVDDYEIFEDIPSFTSDTTDSYLVKPGTRLKARKGDWVLTNAAGVQFALPDATFQELYAPGMIPPIVQYLHKKILDRDRYILELAKRFGLSFFFESNKPGVYGWWWEFGTRGSAEFKVMQGDYILDLGDCLENFLTGEGFNDKQR